MSPLAPGQTTDREISILWASSRTHLQRGSSCAWRSWKFLGSGNDPRYRGPGKRRRAIRRFQKGKRRRCPPHAPPAQAPSLRIAGLEPVVGKQPGHTGWLPAAHEHGRAAPRQSRDPSASLGPWLSRCPTPARRGAARVLTGNGRHRFNLHGIYRPQHADG